MNDYDKLKRIKTATRVAVYKENRLIKLRRISPHGISTYVNLNNGLAGPNSRCCWYDTEGNLSYNMNKMREYDTEHGNKIYILEAGEQLPETYPEQRPPENSGESNGIIEQFQKRITELERQHERPIAKRIDVLFLAYNGFEKRVQMDQSQISDSFNFAIPNSGIHSFYGRNQERLIEDNRIHYQEFRIVFRNEHRAIFREVTR